MAKGIQKEELVEKPGRKKILLGEPPRPLWAHRMTSSIDKNKRLQLLEELADNFYIAEFEPLVDDYYTGIYIPIYHLKGYPRYLYYRLLSCVSNPEHLNFIFKLVVQKIFQFSYKKGDCRKIPQCTPDDFKRFKKRHIYSHKYDSLASFFSREGFNQALYVIYEILTAFNDHLSDHGVDHLKINITFPDRTKYYCTDNFKWMDKPRRFSLRSKKKCKPGDLEEPYPDTQMDREMEYFTETWVDKEDPLFSWADYACPGPILTYNNYARRQNIKIRSFGGRKRIKINSWE